MKRGYYGLTVKDDGRIFVENNDVGKIMLLADEPRTQALTTALGNALPRWSDGDLVGNESVVYLREKGIWNAIWRSPNFPSMAMGPFSDNQIDNALNQTVKIFNRKLSE